MGEVTKKVHSQLAIGVPFLKAGNWDWQGSSTNLKSIGGGGAATGYLYLGRLKGTASHNVNEASQLVPGADQN